MNVFVSPHNDDETLFGAFTLLKHSPIVVVVFDSHAQFSRGFRWCDWKTRRLETIKACCALGVHDVRFLGFKDDDLTTLTPGRIFSAVSETVDDYDCRNGYFGPAREVGGHAQHNLVADALDGLDVTRYLTYTSAGKSTSGREVPIESGGWIAAKLRALACYASQHQIDDRLGCYPHFLRDQREYYAE